MDNSRETVCELLRWLRDETLADVRSDIRKNMGVHATMDDLARMYIECIDNVMSERENV